MTRARLCLVLLGIMALSLGVVIAAPTIDTPIADVTKSVQRVFTMMDAAILGVVEGLTEYLPVSSTGHLLITNYFLGFGTDEHKRAADAYAICIQLGAILAVVYLYFDRVRSLFAGLLGRDKAGARLALNLAVAFAPAVVLALISEKFIKSHLMGVWPVVSAWFVGGLLILAVAAHRQKTDPQAGSTLDELTPKQAFIIGAAQCIAMWPGVSRSLATILGGVLIGMRVVAAVEFSFLLGLITLGAATIYEGIQEGGNIIATFGWLNPLIGMVTAFVAAVVSVKWMVSYLERRGLAIFGYYRIAVAVVVAVILIMK